MITSKLNCSEKKLINLLRESLIKEIGFTPVQEYAHVGSTVYLCWFFFLKSINPEGSLGETGVWLRVLLIKRLGVVCWVRVQQWTHAASAIVSNCQAEIKAKKQKKKRKEKNKR